MQLYKKKAVYLVDDNIDDLQLLAYYLKRAGVGLIRHSSSAKQAYTEILEMSPPPDLVLIDYKMFPMSGRELVDLIEKNGGETFTALLMTGYEPDYVPSAKLFKASPTLREDINELLALYLSD